MSHVRLIRVIGSVAIVTALVGLLALLVHYMSSRVPIPQQEKLTDCTSNRLVFPMVVRYDDPHAFILGLPHPFGEALSFDGEITLRQGTGVVAQIPISSKSMTPCNWLLTGHNLEGQILTWGHTNQEERLDDLLVRGQTYKVDIAFTEAPPTNSSLWLSSIASREDL